MHAGANTNAWPLGRSPLDGELFFMQHDVSFALSFCSDCFPVPWRGILVAHSSLCSLRGSVTQAVDIPPRAAEIRKC